MGASEVVAWQQFFETEPWPEQRADLRAGIVAAVTANVNRTKGRPARPQDFIPRFGEQQPHQTPEQQYQVMRQWVAATGGNIVKRDANG